MVVLTSRGELIGIKDPHGFRPLCLGKLNGSYVLASETCALDLVQAEFVRELDPGEIVIISKDGVKSIHTNTPKRRAFCIFEFIYFARPDSTFFGHNVYLTRKAHGRRLARGSPRWMQTWSCPFPIRAPMPRWGIRKHPASLSRRA
jgi:amidophosphoribosyltransferase